MPLFSRLVPYDRDGFDMTLIVMVLERGLSQIFVVNAPLTIGEEIAAPNIVERTNDSECHCREAEAPVEG